MQPYKVRSRLLKHQDAAIFLREGNFQQMHFVVQTNDNIFIYSMVNKAWKI